MSANAGPTRHFVNISAILLCVGSHALRMVLAATACRTQWYAMALCFFFNVNSGFVKLLQTESLSQYTLVGQSIGTPNIWSLYLKLSINSTAMRAVTNSDPNVEVSTVFCCP
jgi:hypothetical protein